jgi:3-hydroxyacyl-CoA dehydrogenase/enoyl-CoA hydratase/3-hydroxybutyryl-CoA epimerase
MKKTLNVEFKDGFAVIEFDQPDSKVNVLSSQGMVELEQIISQMEQRKDLLGLCIVSKKPDIFIAGAEIEEIEHITSPQEGEDKARAGQKILNRLEKLPITSIALINGACLGGGLELALSCDYRLAAFGDKVKLGLPEVKLGIIPGFGGTKRLARLVGLRKGVELIASGEPVSGSEALKIGLVDGLTSQNRLIEEGIEFLKRSSRKRKDYKPKIKGFLNIFLDQTFLGRAILKNQSRKFILKTTKGRYPAPLKALGVVVKNYGLGLDKALEREARAFGELVIGEVSKNLISVFYLVEKYKKTKWVEAKPRQIRKCAVLGAGVMGAGIAQAFSIYGFPVRMKDLNYQALQRGLRQAKEVYDYALKKKRLKPNQAILGMGLISTTTDYSGFSNADLVVEAVIEDMKIKQNVFTELSSLVNPEAILASNTSCLSISQMSQGVKNRGRIAGMHFFNPVHRMPLVEIIRADETSDETVATLVKFSERIGKFPVVVRDSCGFLVNRILLSYLNEAGFILEEGVSLERIDRVISAFGMPMGPFELVDEIGLDVGYKVAILLEKHFKDRMKAAGILKRIYEQKWFGKKTGKGFYIHPALVHKGWVHKGKGKAVNPEIYEFSKGKESRLSDEEILKRMLYRMINEAAMCLEEKVCYESSDVDIAMIMGAGFPPFRGGLLHYADSLGLDKITADLESFMTKFKSERFTPCNYLRWSADRKAGFYK